MDDYEERYEHFIKEMMHKTNESREELEKKLIVKEYKKCLDEERKDKGVKYDNTGEEKLS